MTDDRTLYICIPATPESLERARARVSGLIEVPLVFAQHVKALRQIMPTLSEDAKGALAPLVDEMAHNAMAACDHGKIVNAMFAEAIISDPDGRKEPLQ